MSWELEDQVVKSTPSPRTRLSLANGLRELGLTPGSVVLTHSSLRSLGWVCGGTVAVVQALMDVLTPSGTLAMPAFTPNNSDPALWQAPSVPSEWVPAIREHMPAFDPRFTPTTGIGAVPETFRSFPDVLRSDHPSVSFTAWGKYAREITSSHPLDHGFGEESPLRKIYDLDGYVLFLGVGYGTCTSFHLAEYRAPHPTPVRQGASVANGDRSAWIEYDDIEFDSDRFPEIGRAYEQEAQSLRSGHVGGARCRLFRQREAVDFAARWLSVERAS